MKVETVGWACGMHPACKRSDHDHVAEDALVRRAGVVRWLRERAIEYRYSVSDTERTKRETPCPGIAKAEPVDVAGFLAEQESKEAACWGLDSREAAAIRNAIRAWRQRAARE